MNKNIKIIGLVLGGIALYYALQYGSTAVHYNCAVLKDDCVPPINLASELIYRVMVHPSWLDKFNIEPTTYTFEDGQFSFWEGVVNGEAVVIRVANDGSPVMQWIFEEKLPGKTPIHPAQWGNIQKWLKAHPEYTLTE